MDIDLLSKMVRELILDNDRVALPGLGFFAAEIVPSTFSDRGYTINPPYRKLYFRQDQGRDGLLARLYAESNGTGTDVAEHIIEDFIRGMREVLDREKVIVFPGLGRLRATRENNYFFVPDEDMDIFPEGAGLEPVSLKTHNVSADVKPASLRPIVPEQVSVPESYPDPSDETSPLHEGRRQEREDTGKTVHETVRKGMPRWLKISFIIVAVLILLAVMVLGIFVALADLCPDFINSILYSPEELEILNY